MSDLTAQGVRSVILTSGTLSPLDSFSCELHMWEIHATLFSYHPLLHTPPLSSISPPHTHSDFPVQYEGPHVISKEQVWVGVVSRGCDGVSLNSSYENRYPYHLWLPHATCLNDIWKAPNLPGSTVCWLVSRLLNFVADCIAVVYLCELYVIISGPRLLTSQVLAIPLVSWISHAIQWYWWYCLSVYWLVI